MYNILFITNRILISIWFIFLGTGFIQVCNRLSDFQPDAAEVTGLGGPPAHFLAPVGCSYLRPA